jgi:hypothetical protein
VIDAVRAAAAEHGRHLSLTVFSEGNEADFTDLVERGAVLSLNGDPLEALNGMIHADVLVTAKSTFSYVAGLVSAGTVIYEPFWYSPMPDWLRIDSGRHRAGVSAGSLSWLMSPASTPRNAMRAA